MHEELLPGFYRIEVPLPDNPLRALNAYFIRGSRRNLLIDNGFNHPESSRALYAALNELDVDLIETDFFLTHLHCDHCGLTSSLLRSPVSKIMCSQEDGTRINLSILEDEYWKNMFDWLLDNGFPRGELGDLYKTHPGRIYGSPQPLNIRPMHEGDSFSYGSYVFTVVEVPGHTPGHLALYESRSKIFISGDHILGTITPNITPWYGVEDSLGDYLNSLKKVASYDISCTFPGHRGVIEDTRGRICELMSHHWSRLDEVHAVLAGRGASHAYEVTSCMRWSLKGITWDEFKVEQKCFATGEALAHLTHLEKSGRAIARRQGGVTLFELA